MSGRPRSRTTIAPWQVWWVDFNPQVGHEQAGRRPAIVVGTALACSLPNGLAILVPCTSTDRKLPIQPRVVLAGRPGFAQCDQVRAMSTDRLMSPHAAGTITKEERKAIAFALRTLVNVH